MTSGFHQVIIRNGKVQRQLGMGMCLRSAHAINKSSEDNCQTAGTLRTACILLNRRLMYKKKNNALTL